MIVDDLDAYQGLTEETAVYPIIGPDGLVYPVLGLVGEAGELAEKLKKALRDGQVVDGQVTQEVRSAMVKELGDVMWYVARVAHHLGVPLSDVATINIEKLRDRKARGAIGGSGDKR